MKENLKNLDFLSKNDIYDNYMSYNSFYLPEFDFNNHLNNLNFNEKIEYLFGMFITFSSIYFVFTNLGKFLFKK